MDLLGLQDLSPYSLLDDMFLQGQPPNPSPASVSAAPMDFNLPATPNASSISSGSSEAAVIDEVQVKAAEEEEDGDEDDEEDQQQEGKQQKRKKQ